MMAKHDCWLGSFVNFPGIQTGIAKKPYILVIFEGGGGGGFGPPAPLWIRPCMTRVEHMLIRSCCCWYEMYGTKELVTLSRMITL